MTTVLLLARRDLARPWLAVGLVGLALAVTVADTLLLRSDHRALLRPGPLALELAAGASLVLADGWAYAPGHAFSSTSESLGSVWPLAGVLAAGLAAGPAVAALAGVGLGLARVGAALVNTAAIDSGGRVLSLTNTIVFYAVGGAVAGYLARLLRRAEKEISATRAREDMARTLHDGVLQTLAVVERRADDPALARLARDQERELREYLFGAAVDGTAGGDLGAALRAAAARYEKSFGGRVQVVVADDLPALDAHSLAALNGAAGEALVNAGKHGRSANVTVYVEPDEAGGVFCSIKDDGLGFDPSVVPEGVGLSRCIRGRVEEAGGRVEVRASPRAGAEVIMWLS